MWRYICSLVWSVFSIQDCATVQAQSTATSSDCETGSKLHVSVLWRHLWLGFSLSIYINICVFIAMTNSEFCSTRNRLRSIHDQAGTAACTEKAFVTGTDLVISGHVSMNGMCMYVCVCARVCEYTVWACRSDVPVCWRGWWKAPPKWGAMRSAQRSCRNKV